MKPKKPPRVEVRWLGVPRPAGAPRPRFTWTVSSRAYPKMAKKLSDRRRNVGVLVTPQVRSTDASYLHFARELADTLDFEFPTSATRDGFYRSPAVPGNFQGLRTVSGIWMDPAGSPPLNRETKATAFASRAHEELFTALVRTLTRRWVPKPYHISRISSSGVPHFTPDVDVKLIHYDRFWAALPLLGECLRRGDGSPAFDKYEIAFCYHVGRRAQVDKIWKEKGTYVTKTRPVTDWLGNAVEAAKYIQVAGLDAFAARTRLVYAGSGSMNYAIGATFAGLKNYMRSRYAYTLEHRTKSSMLGKADGRRGAFSLDVKNFDQKIPAFILRRTFELCEVLSTLIRDLAILGLRAPVLIPSDYEGGSGALWSGDPMNWSAFNGDPGNPSGFGPNFLLNYVPGIFLVVIGLLEAGLLTAEDVSEEGLDLLLRGLNPRVALWNSGDDNVLLFTETRDRDLAERYFNSGEHPYFDMEVEKGMTFLGTLFAEEQGVRYAFPNPISQVQNYLAPERGIDSPHRKYAAFGWFERKKDFSTNPAHKRIDELTNTIFRKHFGETLDTQLERYVRTPVGTGTFNAASLQFMLNPEVIHYKGMIEDLDPRLLRDMFLVIDEEKLVASAGSQVRKAA